MREEKCGMLKFYLRVIVYLFSFVVSMIGLNALDFNRFIKKGHIASAWILYFTVGMSLAYLLGSFLMNLIYYF